MISLLKSRSHFTKYLIVFPSLQLLLPGSIGRLPVDPLLTVGRTPFDVLQKKFDSAKTVSIREINGWYSGRCYFSDSRMQPVAALLATVSDSVAEMGPEFQSLDDVRILPLILKNESPQSLDELIEPQIARINEVLKKEANSNAYPVRLGGSLVVEGMRSSDYEARKYYLRRSGKNLILRLVCAEDSYCLNYIDGVPHNRVASDSEESNAVCYYFRKVKDPGK